MTHSQLLALLTLSSACVGPPRLLHSVVNLAVAPDPEVVSVVREAEPIKAAYRLRLKPGDQVDVPAVDGTFIGNDDLMATAHGTAHLEIGESVWTQSSGRVLYESAANAELHSGAVTLLFEEATFLVDVGPKTLTITSLRGDIAVTHSGTAQSLVVRGSEERIIWEDGRVSPPRPMASAQLNRIVNEQNALLRAVAADHRLVPAAYALPLADANAVAATAELDPQEKQTKKGSNELGTITKQSPAEGTRANVGSKMKLWERRRPTIVPKVYDMSEDKAIAKLGDKFLVGTTVSRTVTGNVEAGRVSAQSPSANAELLEGSTVELTVELQSVPMPKIAGATLDEASKTVADAASGLTLWVSHTEWIVDYTGADKVLSQHQPAGALVPVDQPVSIVRQARGYAVPSVIGLTKAEATKALTKAGLPWITSSEVNNKAGPQTVISQDPPAGSAAGAACTVANCIGGVTLTVSRGPG